MAEIPEYFLLDIDSVNASSMVSKTWYHSMAHIINFAGAKNPKSEVSFAKFDQDGVYQQTFIMSGTLKAFRDWKDVEMPSAKTKPYLYKPPEDGQKWVLAPDGSKYLR